MVHCNTHPLNMHEDVDSAENLNSNTSVLSAYKEDQNCTERVKVLGQRERQCSHYCVAELDSCEVFSSFQVIWGEKRFERV